MVRVRVVVPLEGGRPERTEALELRDVVLEDLERAELLARWIEDYGAVISVGAKVEDVEDVEEED